MSEDHESSGAGGVGSVGMVSERILTAVFDEMATDQELADVASRLRKLVLDDGIFAELALRAAIFPEDQ